MGGRDDSDRRWLRRATTFVRAPLAGVGSPPIRDDAMNMANEIWAVVCRPHQAEPTYIGPFITREQADDWAVEQGRGGGRRVYQIVCLRNPLAAPSGAGGYLSAARLSAPRTRRSAATSPRAPSGNAA